jgi:uncharacterized RDD family membrane protein YckC
MQTSYLNQAEALQESSSPVKLASTGQRLGNMFLDLIFYFVFALVFDLISGFIGLANFIQEINDSLLGIFIFLLYYTPQEAFSGRTLGKLITGTKAIGEDGTKLTFGQALGITLCRFIPFEVFSFLGGNGQPRGWHDRIPKTKVISLKKI